MPKIRVVFTAEILVRDFDGASRTIFELIDRIPTESFDFLFVCGIPPGDNFEFPFFTVPTLTIPFNKTYRIAIPFFTARTLIKKLDAFRPDVIHISTPSILGFFMLKYAKKRNIPVISIYHTHFISYIQYYAEKSAILQNLLQRWAKYLMKKFYNSCAKIYIPSAAVAKDLEMSGIDTRLFHWWPRGLDDSTFYPGPHPTSEVHQFLDKEKPNILFVSRLVWEKNLKTLIKIYQLAQSSGRQYHFIIAGDGVAYEDLKLAMADATFTGHLDRKQLAALYAGCDIFIFTSVTETYGNVVTEALASGLPCVIANGGGSAGQIRDGISGFLCDPENASEYLAKTEILLREPELRSQFAESGLKYATSLSWSRLCEQYFNELKNLTNSNFSNPDFKKLSDSNQQTHYISI